MDIAAYVCWFGLFLVVETLLSAVQVPLRMRSSQVVGVVALVVKAALVVFLAYEIVAATSGFCWHHDFLLAALYCALAGDVLAGVVWSVACLVRPACLVRGPSHERREGRRPLGETLRGQCPRIAVSLVFGFAVLVAGTWNMQTVACRTYTVSSHKLSARHTVAFLSDLHVGTAQQFSSLEDVVAQINASHPDLVIIGGDVSDEKTSAAWLDRAYRLLGTLEAPTYFVYGNHDRQPDGDLLGGRTYTDDELVQAIERNGITVLADEYVTVADEVMLLGREDISRGKDRRSGDELAARNPDQAAFLIVADHQPYADEADVAPLKADLQVSGHTHAGQLFPLQFCYNAIGLPAYGEYELGGSCLLVSAGESGWGFPLRTEARSEWNLITLEPAS